METNEQNKQALMQDVESVLNQFLEEVQMVKEGDLEEVEQAVLDACLAVGRGWLKRLLEQHCPSPARRKGTCGHRQRLVATRPKRLLTLVGEVEVHRPYYQCLREKPPRGSAGCLFAWRGAVGQGVGGRAATNESGCAETGQLSGSDNDIRRNSGGL